MHMDQDFEIYTGKTFSELCKNIVDNQEEMKTQIDILVGELKPLIKTVNDAMIIVPLLKEYIDVSVKNNEHLIKLAAITNKIKTKYSAYDVDIGGNGGGGYEAIMTEEEKAEIAKHIRAVQNSQTQLKIEKSKLGNTEVE
jgi:hypothetical protein